jgi:hypothetical protein
MNSRVVILEFSGGIEPGDVVGNQSPSGSTQIPSTQRRGEEVFFMTIFEQYEYFFIFKFKVQVAVNKSFPTHVLRKHFRVHNIKQVGSLLVQQPCQLRLQN